MLYDKIKPQHQEIHDTLYKYGCIQLMKRKITGNGNSNSSIQPVDHSITAETTEIIINNIIRKCNRITDAIVELYNLCIYPRHYITDAGFTREFFNHNSPEYHSIKSEQFLTLFMALHEISHSYQAEQLHLVNYYQRFIMQHGNIFRNISGYILFHRNIIIPNV